MTQTTASPNVRITQTPKRVRETKTQYLNRTLGGKWKFCGGFGRRWECEDGRSVQYTAPPVDEFDNICGPSQCWLYPAPKSGQNTKPFYFYDPGVFNVAQN